MIVICRDTGSSAGTVDTWVATGHMLRYYSDSNIWDGYCKLGGAIHLHNAHLTCLESNRPYFGVLFFLFSSSYIEFEMYGYMQNGGHKCFHPKSLFYDIFWFMPRRWFLVVNTRKLMPSIRDLGIRFK